MKHFIINIIYRAEMDEINRVLPQHRAFLRGGYERGLLLCSGPQNPRTGGIIVARAESLDAIQDFFQQDPYLLQGVAEHQFIEFEPVLRQSFLEDWVNGI
ncbi:MAG TPA: YciI family protein [Anaerolineaceae bacterium]